MPIRSGMPSWLRCSQRAKRTNVDPVAATSPPCRGATNHRSADHPAGWSQLKGEYGSDPAVYRDPSRQDWIEMRPESPQDLERPPGLLAVAIAETA